MKHNLTLIIICWLLIGLVLLTSCGTQYRCYPSKGSKDYAILLGDKAPDNWRKTTLVSVTKTMKGNKHLFIAENGDSVIRYYNSNLKQGCYYLKM